MDSVLGLSPDLQAKLLASLLGLAFVVALRLVLLRLANRQVEDPRSLYRWRKSITYASFALALLLVGRPGSRPCAASPPSSGS